MNQYAWLVKREFWENRAIWIVPACIGIVLTLAALFGRVDLEDLPSGDQTRTVGGVVLFAFGVTFFAVMNIYSTWYLLDCLYADRKDRSILFWKSLPISDAKTVLAKLFVGLFAIPLVYFIAADVSTAIMAFIVSVRARSSFGGLLWQPDLWLQLQALWLFLIVTTAIWYLPFVGYLLVISAWAKRALMLWSIVPPLAIYLLEKWFFGTHVIGVMLKHRALDYTSLAFHTASDQSIWSGSAMANGSRVMPDSVWHLLDPVAFITSPATWVGLVVGIALVMLAIQLRMRRTDT